MRLGLDIGFVLCPAYLGNLLNRSFKADVFLVKLLSGAFFQVGKNGVF